MTKSYPKITIITPSYNQGQYVEQTIRSIIDQGYPNLEYIIIDGGSTDNTVDIIKKYESQITYWLSEPDNGQAHAINKGLAIATGDIVNWINSDDYLEPDALWALAKAYEKNPAGELFCGYTHCFWHETGATSHTYRMGLKKTVANTILHIEMNQPGTFYKTHVIKTLGGVNESLRYVFDNELWMRYLCAYGQKKVIKMKALLAHFRQHGQSKSFGEGFEGFNKEQQEIIKNIAQQTNLPGYLLSKLNISTYEIGYYKTADWELTQLNLSKFHALFANQYMVTLYNDGFKKEAADCVRMALKFGTFEFNRKNIGLLRKVLLKH